MSLQYIIAINIRKAILVSLILSGVAYAYEVHNLAQAVNIAGKQRMFTQRMLKDYGMLGLGVDFANPKKDLEDTMKEFEEHLEALDKFNKDPEIKKSINKQKEIYSSIKNMLLQKPTIDNAIKLQEKLDKLLKVADETTKLFAAKTGKQSGKIINISGRQRMLSQRMANLYMLKAWGIKDSAFKKKLTDSMELFEKSLNVLLKSQLNTPKINELLGKVKNDYKFFKIMNKTSNSFVPSLIYEKSNEILKNMDEVTKLYASQKIQ